MTDNKCGHLTADGSPCEHPATDGETCWLPSHGGDASSDGGRPSKFTDEKAREIIEAAEEAKSIRGCGRAAGVSKDTVVNWLRENPEYESEDGEQRELFAAFMRARAKAESLLTRGPLTRPDEVNGQHARFLLKNSFDYDETTRLEIDDGDEADDDLSELKEMADEMF